jgi:hypothetical protein
MPKKSITALYAEFGKALAALNAERYWRDGTGEAEYDAVLGKASDLCRRIVSTPADPADPIPDLLKKIAAAGWGGGLRPGESLDDWDAQEDTDAEEHVALVSIREDLRAMLGKPPRRASRRSGKPERVAAAPSR